LPLLRRLHLILLQLLHLLLLELVLELLFKPKQGCCRRRRRGLFGRHQGLLEGPEHEAQKHAAPRRPRIAAT
jgi:hypothetical protein